MVPGHGLQLGSLSIFNPVSWRDVTPFRNGSEGEKGKRRQVATTQLDNSVLSLLNYSAAPSCANFHRQRHFTVHSLLVMQVA